jgi:hypothetical protein
VGLEANERVYEERLKEESTKMYFDADRIIKTAWCVLSAKKSKANELKLMSDALKSPFFTTLDEWLMNFDDKSRDEVAKFATNPRNFDSMIKTLQKNMTTSNVAGK